ncbi:SHOCT domain-containing protein [Streptomyces sp. NBC_00209]
MPSSGADELTKLAGLREAGILTPEEFDAQKSRILGQ